MLQLAYYRPNQNFQVNDDATGKKVDAFVFCSNQTQRTVGATTIQTMILDT